MKAIELITNTVTPIHTSDTGFLALQLMDEYKISHLPIVNNEEFLGVISEIDILNLNDPEMPIGNHSLSLGQTFVYEDQHIYDIIQLISEQNLTIVPVINYKKNYLGSITLTELTHLFANLTSIKSPGAIIILELNTNDYVMSQIAQIIESNDAKILSSYIKTNNDSTKMDVIIKINKNDIAAIIQTFNRYNYIVKEYFSEKSQIDNIKARYDEFINWLNV